MHLAHQPRPNTKPRQALLALLCATLPLAASAHVGADGGGHHNFLAGFMHPLLGVDHLAAMLAVGLWSALAARRAGPDLLWAPLGFAFMLLCGALMGLAGLSLPALEPMVAASVLVMGLLVASRLHLGALPAFSLVGGFALFHGLAHGQELLHKGQAAPLLAGMLCATVLLHASGMALGWALRKANTWLPRLMGSTVALLGLGLLVKMA